MDSHTTLTYGVDKHLTDVDTVVSDARPARKSGKLSLQTHGFTLEPQRTGLRTREFFDKEGLVERVYYAEMRREIKRATGCDEVHILEHIVRDSGAADARGKKNPFAGGGNGINGYAGVVHTDFRADRALELAMSKGEGLNGHANRFMIVNTWRNISDEHPIYDNTLAMCDGKTVHDVLPCDVHHPNGKKSKQYRLSVASADEHRWFYFPRMQKDELLIFTQYDSDPKAAVRYCFHTAFKDSNAPANVGGGPAPQRQSIEVRAVALFRDTLKAPPHIARNLSDEVWSARTAKRPLSPQLPDDLGLGNFGRRQLPAPAAAADMAALVDIGDDFDDDERDDVAMRRVLEMSMASLEEDRAYREARRHLDGRGALPIAAAAAPVRHVAPRVDIGHDVDDNERDDVAMERVLEMSMASLEEDRAFREALKQSMKPASPPPPPAPPAAAGGNAPGKRPMAAAQQ